MARQYKCALLHDTHSQERPDWRTLEETQATKVLYDSRRKSNSKAPFPEKITHVPSFTRGIAAGLFTHSHQVFYANAYSLVVFDGSPNLLLFKTAYAEFIASCFKIDEEIYEEMALLYIMRESLLTQCMRCESINDEIDDFSKSVVVVPALKSALSLIIETNMDHEKIYHKGATQVVLRLKALLNSGWD